MCNVRVRRARTIFPINYKHGLRNNTLERLLFLLIMLHRRVGVKQYPMYELIDLSPGAG